MLFIESVLLFTVAAWLGNFSLKNKSSLNQIVKFSSRLVGEPQLNMETLSQNCYNAYMIQF